MGRNYNTTLGALVGASVTVQQGAEMGLIFFALRLVWLYVVRRYFESAWLCVTRSFLNWRRRCS